MIIESKQEVLTGRVLIEFWAEWCSPCRVLKPIVEEFAGNREDINVYFCNVDEDYDMSMKYGIRNIPTLIYLEGGNIKNKAVGVLQLPELEKLISTN